MLTKYYYHHGKGGVSIASIKLKTHPSSDVVRKIMFFIKIIVIETKFSAEQISGG